MNHDKIIMLIAIITSSSVAAFSAGIQRKANNNEMTLLQLTADVSVHAVSGVILGLVLSRFTQDIMTLCAVAGIGGLIGQKTVYFLWYLLKAVMANAKNVKLEDINKAMEDDEKNGGDDNAK